MKGYVLNRLCCDSLTQAQEAGSTFASLGNSAITRLHLLERDSCLGTDYIESKYHRRILIRTQVGELTMTWSEKKLSALRLLKHCQCDINGRLSCRTSALSTADGDHLALPENQAVEKIT
jgi:hypothetical protein